MVNKFPFGTSQTGKRDYLFRIFVWPGNFPVGRTKKTFTIYIPTGISGNLRSMVNRDTYCTYTHPSAPQVHQCEMLGAPEVFASKRFHCNIICAMFVILNWRGLLIIPRNDFAPSETLGTLTESTGANYSTSICNLASRHLGLLPCRRCGINTLLFRRKGFSRPVMYNSNSNAIFQPELLIISGDVNVNPGPVSKRNQALGQLLQHVHRDTQRQL